MNAAIPFAPSATFSRENALYLAHASDIAYFRKPAAAAAERLGLSEVVALRHKVNRTRGFVGVCSTHAVLAFRGTEPATLANWVTDAVFSLASKSEYAGRVHSGFSAALASVWPEVSACLKRVGDVPLFVTGHSMGGALAKLTACRLADAGVAAMATYTFGSPRLGDATFCERYRLPTYRVVNKMDLVPEIPLAGFRRLLPDKPKFTNEKILGRLHKLAGRLPAYSHVPTFVYIDAAGALLTEPEIVRWHSADIAEALGSRGKLFVTGITDHLIGNYIRSLGSAPSPPSTTGVC